MYFCTTNHWMYILLRKRFLGVFKKASAFTMVIVFASMPISTSFASVGAPGCSHDSKKISGAHNGQHDMKDASHNSHTSPMMSKKIPMGGSVANIEKSTCHKKSKPCPMQRKGHCETEVKGCSMVKCSSDTSLDKVALEYSLDVLLAKPAESAFDESFTRVKPVRFTLASLRTSPLERPPTN